MYERVLMDVKIAKRCRVCGSKGLVPILSLGEQYVTNFVDDPHEKAYKGPLELVLCDRKQGGCGLLQLRHTFDHDILYRKYWYRSGISTSMVKALADIARSAERLVSLSRGDVVVDIGSNDGTLLRQYRTQGLLKVGFEPSNLYMLAKGKGTKVIHDYFNYGSFRRAVGSRKAKVITSIAMFYDLPDPNGFVEDIKSCLERDGLWIIQMNYLGLMLANNTFDNISHEHLEYYSLLSLESLLGRHGLEIFDVELNEVNGGSFRLYVRNAGAGVRAPSGAEKRLHRQRAWEERREFDTERPYVAFARRIERTKEDLRDLLQRETKNGKRIFIYGASTRGLVVLQFAGIDRKLVEAATDKNPDKWGKYIVGTGIPIIPIEEYRKAKPDYLFVLPYHFIDEIRNQEKEFLKGGGKMIVAIPELRLIGK